MVFHQTFGKSTYTCGHCFQLIVLTLEPQVKASGAASYQRLPQSYAPTRDEPIVAPDSMSQAYRHVSIHVVSVEMKAIFKRHIYRRGSKNGGRLKDDAA